MRNLLMLAIAAAIGVPLEARATLSVTGTVDVENTLGAGYYSSLAGTPPTATASLNSSSGRALVIANLTGLTGSVISGAIALSSDQASSPSDGDVFHRAGVNIASTSTPIPVVNYSAIGIATGNQSYISIGGVAYDHRVISVIHDTGYLDVHGECISEFISGSPATNSGPASTTAWFSFWDTGAVPTQLDARDVDSNGAHDANDVNYISAAIGGSYGGVSSSTFDLNGDSSVTSSDVDYLLTHAFGTVRGDANLDGHVNFDDLTILSQHYNKPGMLQFGDFNSDFVVNFDDLTILSQNYGYGGGSLRAANFASDWALAQALAPEPGSLTAMGAAGLLLALRRRVA